MCAPYAPVPAQHAGVRAQHVYYFVLSVHAHACMCMCACYMCECARTCVVCVAYQRVCMLACARVCHVFIM